MSKISISVPDEVLDFLDNQGKNRSRTIVTILKDYKEKKQAEELEKAYSEYSDFVKDETEEWEQTACIDLSGDE